jgi:hypothetical protein
MVERLLAQRAVAIPALEWRLRDEVPRIYSLRNIMMPGDTAELAGQSPLPTLAPF